MVEEQNKGNYVTIEQMSGVSCVETEPRYSAPWYPNIDVALMGIQSTAQFVEKYHHIIGKVYLGGNHWTTGHPAGYTVKVVVRNRKESVVQGGCCETSGP